MGSNVGQCNAISGSQINTTQEWMKFALSSKRWKLQRAVVEKGPGEAVLHESLGRLRRAIVVVTLTVLHERQGDDDGAAAQRDERDEIEDEEAPRGVTKRTHCCVASMASRSASQAGAPLPSVRAAERESLLEAG